MASWYRDCADCRWVRRVCSLRVRCYKKRSKTRSELENTWLVAGSHVTVTWLDTLPAPASFPGSLLTPTKRAWERGFLPSSWWTNQRRRNKLKSGRWLNLEGMLGLQSVLKIDINYIHISNCKWFQHVTVVLVTVNPAVDGCMCQSASMYKHTWFLCK